MGINRGTRFLFGVFAVCFAFLFLPGLSAQQSTVDFNEKYNFPFSFGALYSMQSPVSWLGTDYGYDFDTIDFGMAMRMPLTGLPVIQPEAYIGMTTVLSSDKTEESEQFNHRRLFGMVGAAYVHRMSKEFELGADLLVGLCQNYYPYLDENPEIVRGDQAFLVSLGAKLALNLSYNMSLEFIPSIRYRKAFNASNVEGAVPLNRFDGFTFGIGVTGSYRLGDDPDAPQVEVRSIRFSEARINPLFAAMQSFYVKNPVGNVTITNTEKFPLTNLQVSFLQSGFMDGPTGAAVIDELAPEESRTVDLLASFNRQVFTTEGTTPMTGEVIVQYEARGRQVQQSRTVTYDLYDKEALTWDDTTKAAAFVTPADSALRNFTSYVRQACRDAVIQGLSDPLQTAMQVYYGLDEMGLLYQKDPTTPFEAAQENTLVIDAVSLPRNTLKRSTGDCDDLSVLFTSLLETAGIETAFVTVPGHIYTAFNTKVSSRDYLLVHPDRRMTIELNGELWVPLEVTLVGRESFLSAWRTGIEQFNAYSEKPEDREIVIIRKAQETYRPVVLTETDLGLQYGEQLALFNSFSGELDKLVAQILESFEGEAREKGTKGSYNQLGIAAAQLGEYTKAEQAFNTALSLDRNYLPAKINLANVYFMKQEYQNALRLFHSVEADYEEQGRTESVSYHRVVLNLSRTYYELENYDLANQYSARLKELNPALAEEYSYLSTGESGSRAADIHSRPDVLFDQGE
ncbi:MAG: tetratricopeptide repeat protein [Spirochaetales bacterium]|nr:tetratricopeptide repeat protein [Spirochaetales bacterium]